MLEPDAATRTVPTGRQPPGTELSPHALQILMTEHRSLLAARSLVYTESMSRTSIFVAALTGSVVALALVGQATDFGTGFVVFALVLLPIDSVVAGAMVAIAAIGLDLGTASTLTLGAAAFLVSLGLFFVWGRRQIARGLASLEPRFPGTHTTTELAGR